MFCSSCGTKLPDEANFCWKCGKPQKSGASIDKPKWEMCEIETEYIKKKGLFSSDMMLFNAKAIGPMGVYSAGKSTQFKSYTDDESRDILDDLMKHLVADGWEPTGETGSFWWSYRFRRYAR